MNQPRMKKGIRQELTGRVIEMRGTAETGEPIYCVVLQCDAERVQVIFASELARLAVCSLNSSQPLKVHAEIEKSVTPYPWHREARLMPVAKYVCFPDEVEP